VDEPKVSGADDGRATGERRDLVARLVDLRPGEGGPLVLAGLYFFFILCSDYVIRPTRDSMGVAGGEDAPSWLFSGTLAGMLVAQPLFVAAVSRFPRRRFIPLTYRFFAAQLVLFWLLLRTAPEG